MGVASSVKSGPVESADVVVAAGRSRISNGRRRVYAVEGDASNSTPNDSLEDHDVETERAFVYVEEMPKSPVATTVDRDDDEAFHIVQELNLAAVNGDKSAVAKITEKRPELFLESDSLGRTPLMMAVLAERLEIAEFIVKKTQKLGTEEAADYVHSRDKGGRTALHSAAHKGNVRCLKFLLSKGCDPLAKDENGLTPLHLSTRHRSSRCLNLILNRLKQGGVDDQDNENKTALHLSASYANLKHVQSLLKHYSNVGMPDAEGKTPLHWAAAAAARDGRTARDAAAIVRLFGEEAPSVVNWQDYEGRTALHVAIAEGNVHIVSTLIREPECNVNAMDNMFRTPLHWAAALGHARIVQMLLAHPRPRRPDVDPEPRFCEHADWSTSDANGATPLHYAARNNFDDAVKAFLDREGVVDVPDLEGRTALMWAACEGADDVVRTMIAAGSDVGAVDKTGGAALHVAAFAGKTSTVKLLVARGAAVDGCDHAGHTPVFRACQQGHMMTVQALLEAKARVDIFDAAGRSPLHWAALGGHAPIARLLIAYGLAPNLADRSGRGPLHCAAFGGFVGCMKALLETGADPDMQDNEGKTPLHWSSGEGHLDAAKLLLIDHDAFPNHREFYEERFTPLDAALLGGHNHVAQLLIEHGGLSINAIQDFAASVVQAAFRGYRVRKSFQEKMNLMIQHDQLRKESQLRRRAREAERSGEEWVAGTEAEVLDRSNVEANTGEIEVDGFVGSLPGEIKDSTDKL